MNMTSSPATTATPVVETTTTAKAVPAPAKTAPKNLRSKPTVAKPAAQAKTTSATKPATQPAVKAKAAKPVGKSAAPSPAKSAPKAPAKPVSTKAAKPTAKPTTPKPAAAPAKPLKDKKVKVVRDSFTIPKAELLQIGEMKKRAMGMGVAAKKSELIRAGLSALAGMTDAGFKKALASVPTIKTGRPTKD